MTKEKQIADLLNALEVELQRVELWQASSPSKKALASQEPFALDALAPQQWLQWVFIPRFRLLLEMSRPLPIGFSMAPYFEESWKEASEYSVLITLIQDIDKVCSDA